MGIGKAFFLFFSIFQAAFPPCHFHVSLAPSSCLYLPGHPFYALFKNEIMNEVLVAMFVCVCVVEEGCGMVREMAKLASPKTWILDLLSVPY